MTRTRLASNRQNDDIGHRVKRMKTEKSKPAALLTREDKITGTKDVQESPNRRVDLVVNQDSATYRSPYSATSNLSSEPYSIQNDATHLRSNAEPQTPEIVSQGNDVAVQANAKMINVRVDFSNAPSNPFDMAIWVAQKIQQFQDGKVKDHEMNDERNGSRCSSVSHLTGSSTHEKSEKGLRSRSAVGKPKKRGENNQTDWSDAGILCLALAYLFGPANFSNTIDQDNDLRGRINARAKIIFGKNSCEQKALWIEKEFQKRRKKREMKRKRDGNFPGFTLHEDLAIELFPDLNTDLSKDIRAAGKLLLNTLQGVRNAGVSPNLNAVTALKSALADSGTDLSYFIEALRVLGGSSQVAAAIQGTMDKYTELRNNSTESKTVSMIAYNGNVSGASGRPSSLKKPGIRSRSTRSHDFDTNDQSDDVVKALNAATDILSDIATGSSDTYVTPYGHPLTQDDRNGSASLDGTIGMDSIADDEPKQNGAELSLDRSQIDDLLKLAAGGAESDEDDDDSITDVPDENNLQEDLAVSHQPDGDVSATLQRIVNELMFSANGGNNPAYAGDERGLSVGTSQTDIFGSNTAKDQAAALTSLFAQAGVSINTIIPAAQSLATSQLYAHLSSRANRFPTSGGGIDPNHASAYGNTAEMTQRMLSRPGNPIQSFQSGPSVSRGDAAKPVRGKSAEEMKKIRAFGYPPLPGSRPGQKRKP